MGKEGEGLLAMMMMMMITSNQLLLGSSLRALRLFPPHVLHSLSVSSCSVEPMSSSPIPSLPCSPLLSPPLPLFTHTHTHTHPSMLLLFFFCFYFAFLFSSSPSSFCLSSASLIFLLSSLDLPLHRFRPSHLSFSCHGIKYTFVSHSERHDASTRLGVLVTVPDVKVTRDSCRTRDQGQLSDVSS